MCLLKGYLSFCVFFFYLKRKASIWDYILFFSSFGRARAWARARALTRSRGRFRVTAFRLSNSISILTLGLSFRRILIRRMENGDGSSNSERVEAAWYC